MKVRSSSHEISGRLSIDLSTTTMRPRTRTSARRPVVIGSDEKGEPSLPSEGKMWLQGHELEKHHFACKSIRFDTDSSEKQHAWISKHFCVSPAEDFCQAAWRLLFLWSADGAVPWSCLPLNKALNQMTSRVPSQPKLFCHFQCWWVKVCLWRSAVYILLTSERPERIYLTFQTTHRIICQREKKTLGS